MGTLKTKIKQIKNYISTFRLTKAEIFFSLVLISLFTYSNSLKAENFYGGVVAYFNNDCSYVSTNSYEVANYDKNVRPVQTASLLQVREKIKKNTSEEWKKYKDYLKTMEETLQSGKINY